LATAVAFHDFANRRASTCSSCIGRIESIAMQNERLPDDAGQTPAHLFRHAQGRRTETSR
jgi:hypothetical protein